MTNTNGKFFTRFIAVAFVVAAFAGCAMMFANSGKSLFNDHSAQTMAQTVSQTN